MSPNSEQWQQWKMEWLAYHLLLHRWELRKHLTQSQINEKARQGGSDEQAEKAD